MVSSAAALKTQLVVFCQAVFGFTMLSLRNLYSTYILGKGMNLNLGVDTIKNMFNSRLIDANKEAFLMKPAPNDSVHVLEDPSKPCKLLDFMKKDRLLVLNFGSST